HGPALKLVDAIARSQTSRGGGATLQDGADAYTVLGVFQRDAQEATEHDLLFGSLAQHGPEEFHDAADRGQPGHRPAALHPLRSRWLECQGRPIHLVLGEIKAQAKACQHAVADNSMQLRPSQAQAVHAFELERVFDATAHVVQIHATLDSEALEDTPTLFIR